MKIKLYKSENYESRIDKAELYFAFDGIFLACVQIPTTLFILS